MRSRQFRIAGVAALGVAAVLMLPDSALAQRRILGRLGRPPVAVYTVPGPTTYYYAARPAPTGVVITYTPGYPSTYVPGPVRTYPAATPPASPPDVSTAAEPAAATAADDRPPAGANTAVIKLRLPAADAELWVEGEKVGGTGTVRQFMSPPLKPGEGYTVTLQARWSQDGQPMTETHKAEVYAGDRVTVDFGQSARRVGPPEIVPKEYTGPAAPPPLPEK